jgi:hypothetical protein
MSDPKLPPFWGMERHFWKGFFDVLALKPFSTWLISKLSTKEQKE